MSGAGLTWIYQFHSSITMEKDAALAALAALAQESRLDIYRLLVQAGADGMAAGQIGEHLGVPAATLAFHLKELKTAGLVTFTRHGRSLVYAAVYPTMNALLFYLTENCCGRPTPGCLPLCVPESPSDVVPDLLPHPPRGAFAKEDGEPVIDTHANRNARPAQ
ncbi:MAG: metalloregulator ArsR/SmtB family transcription factor [Acetobacteraceae bacterium]|nr:metalloregulator ArsR/SmtB family transcription factor [Acetobacteraceae bacterium]